MEGSALHRRFVLALACGALLLGCGPEPLPERSPEATTVPGTKTPPAVATGTDPGPWTRDATREGGALLLKDTIDVNGTEEEAATELLLRLLCQAVELVIIELADERKAREHAAELRRVFVDRFPDWVKSHEEVQRRRIADGLRLGLQVRVLVARDKMARELQAMGLGRADPGALRVVLMLRRPAVGAEGSASAVAVSYLDDLAEDLSRELVQRGFRTRSWRDVAARLSENRAGLDEERRRLALEYVQQDDWQRPADERYALPLLVLRGEGRILVGFRIVELGRRELALHTLLRADVYDLLSGQSLGYETESGRLAIGDKTLVEARQALITSTARRLVTRTANGLEALLGRERQRVRSAYTFTFEGYDPVQLERIETLLAGVLAEDLDASRDGTRLIVRAQLDRDPVPVRDEIARSLRALGLGAQPARRDGAAMTFARE